MDENWQTKYIWGGLMTESFNGGGTGISCDVNSLLFDLLSLILKHRLLWGMKCKELDECWRTEDSWDGFMTESFNGR